MTKVEIIIIDDEIKQLNLLSEKYENVPGLKFTSKVEDFFTIDRKSLKVALKEPLDDLKYVFIHHSISNIRLPNNFFPQIESLLSKEKVFFFSGGKDTNHHYRAINRAEFYTKFHNFVDFHNQVCHWYIPVFYHGAYKNVFIKKQLHYLKSISIEELNNNESYLLLEKLLNLEKDITSEYSSSIEFLNDIKKHFTN